MGIWLQRLSYLAVLGFPLSLLGTRLELFDFRVGFQGLRYTLYLALGIFVLGLIFAFVQRRSNPPSARRAAVAAALSLLPIIGLGSQVVTARSVPAIHNISTDTVDPPNFERIAQIRTPEDNPLEYNSKELAALQQAAYPAVKTLYTSMSKGEAHDRALVLAQVFGWDIVDRHATTGTIEATETTALWQFKDDIVIRVREHENGVVIDLRSVSRVGQSDLGANAKRIEKFLAAFEE